MIIMAIAVLSTTAVGDSDDNYQEPEAVCPDAADPEGALPIFGTSDGGARADGVAFSYVSYLYPPISSIYYQTCNVKHNGAPLDLVWSGPDIAAGHGNPLFPGLCIDIYRTSYSATRGDTTFYVTLNRYPTTAPAYVDCEHADFRNSTSTLSSYSRPSLDEPTPLPLRLHYRVYRDDTSDTVMFRIFWWPSSLTVIAGFDSEMKLEISPIGRKVVVEEIAGLEENDQNVIEEFLHYTFDGVIVFMELAPYVEDSDDDDDDDGEQPGAWASVAVSTKIKAARAVPMPMPIVIKNQDVTALIALVKSAAVKEN